jgi:pantetheine-phosphate adenylyltransferase
MKTALYPGSFDPITKGHQSIALRAAQLFDHLTVAIGENSDKHCRYTQEERLSFLRKTFEDVSNISIVSYQGLTVDYCKENNIHYIVRGLRSDMDWGMESSISHANKLLSPSIETVFLLTAPEFIGISSSAVREILSYKGDISAFVPKEIIPLIEP